ncbi:hypothetical protein CS022_02005 [Veronia nyctiphanis]|uniref:Uncharacterized protein n=1 Tax=Veronia nyctiphanis TaxID=1278244 RepID=A0A4Q0YT72_9GAMM|nr:helix-turn-helix domain-containing protein [Veronia nyctiphanis]RXJ74406.1 hypothetical protein CS022_02005 [Veronia nyctiphanis]
MLLSLKNTKEVAEGESLPVTQQELADLMGVSRQTLSKNLSFLSRRGWIELKNKRINIIDADMMRGYIIVSGVDVLDIIK